MKSNGKSRFIRRKIMYQNILPAIRFKAGPCLVALAVLAVTFHSSKTFAQFTYSSVSQGNSVKVGLINTESFSPFFTNGNTSLVATNFNTPAFGTYSGTNDGVSRITIPVLARRS